jgi:hypothetical protein
VRQRDAFEWTKLLVGILTLIAVVIYTGIQCYQTSLIRAGNKISRDQLTLAYPPRLFLSQTAIYKKENPQQLPEFTAQEMIEGTAWIVNTGREIAVINKIECMPHWMSGPLPLFPVYYERHVEKCKAMVISDGVTLNARSDQSFMRPGDVGVVEFSTIMPQAVKEAVFYLLGYVVYQDRLDPPTRRALFFGRKYDRSKNYFVKVEDSGYEHEE